MVQQSAPPKTLQTFDGLVMARVCTGDACFLVQAMTHQRVDDDGTWYAAYWDPENPARNATASGSERCEADAIGRMVDALRSLIDDEE